MTDLRPEQQADAWTQCSTAYDTNVVPMMAPWVQSMMELAKLQGDEEALEVAAGSGALTEQLAPKVKSVFATDFAPGMLDRLRTRIAMADIENVEVALMNGMALELDSERFDVAFCNFGLMLFPVRTKGFAELCRVLKPGGRAFVSAWSTPDKFPALTLFIDGVKKTMPKLEMPEKPSIFSLSNKETFAMEMASAGFSAVSIHTVTHPFVAASPEAAWEVMKDSGPPTRKLLESIPEEELERLRQTVVGLIRQKCGDGEVRLENEAHIAVGTV